MDTPPFMTYVYVMSRDSVIIVLLHAALNGLGVQCANLQNAYLRTNPKERVYFYYGAEFGKYWVKIIDVVRELYGLKGVEISWVAAIFQVMRNLGFQYLLDYSDV